MTDGATPKEVFNTAKKYGRPYSLVAICVCHREIAIEGYREYNYNEKDPEEIYRCAKTGLECEVEEVCEYCLGEGTIPADATDLDGNVERGVDNRKCICKSE